MLHFCCSRDADTRASIAVREEELAEQSRAAEEAVAHAREEMARAEARSAAAEAAKIELSLRLAAALSEQEAAEDVSGVPTARSVSKQLCLYTVHGLCFADSRNKGHQDKAIAAPSSCAQRAGGHQEYFRCPNCRVGSCSCKGSSESQDLRTSHDA